MTRAVSRIAWVLTAKPRRRFESADALVELDLNPLMAITLTATITKTVTARYSRQDDLERPLAVGRMTKKDLLRVLRLSLKDSRFAAKLRADMGL
jgi:hypothetical protein